MDTVWVALFWLVAVAAIYFVVSYWSRVSQMRRRLFQGMDEEAAVRVAVSEDTRGPLRRWLTLAGFRSASAPTTFVLSCLVCFVIGLAVLIGMQAGLLDLLRERAAQLPEAMIALVGPVLTALPWVLFFVLVALPWLYVRSARRDRVLELERSLPIALDLLATMSETGLGFDASLNKLVEGDHTGGALHDELRIFQLETLAGIPRIQCFRRLSARCEVGSMSIFCSALVQAEQVGAGFSTVLRHQADDLRGRRRERAMVMAQALPVKLVFPLVICFLPGIFLTTLGPAFMQFFKMAEGVIQSY
jgi:tight adherence protein C